LLLRRTKMRRKTEEEQRGEQGVRGRKNALVVVVAVWRRVVKSRGEGK